MRQAGCAVGSVVLSQCLSLERPGFNLRVIVHLPNSAKSVVENSKTSYLHCGDF